MRRLLSASLLASALVLPAAASAAPAKTHGVVVKIDRRSHSVVLVRPNGDLVRVGAPTGALPTLGTTVTVVPDTGKGRRRGKRLKVTRRHARASLRGVVVAVTADSFTIRSRGLLLTVPGANDHRVGDHVVVRLVVDRRGRLDERTSRPAGEHTRVLRLRGAVVEVAAATLRVKLTDGSTIVVATSGRDVSAVHVGDTVEVHVQAKPIAGGTAYKLLQIEVETAADAASGTNRGTAGDDDSTTVDTDDGASDDAAEPADDGGADDTADVDDGPDDD